MFILIQLEDSDCQIELSMVRTFTVAAAVSSASVGLTAFFMSMLRTIEICRCYVYRKSC